MLKVIRHSICSLILSSLVQFNSICQPKDLPTVEFERWMNTCGLISYFDIYTVDRSKTVIELRLIPTLLFHNCDSLTYLWNEVAEHFSDGTVQIMLLHELMLDNWAFLNEVPVSSAKIIINCNINTSNHIIIFGEPDGGIKMTDNNVQSQGDGKFFIAKDKLFWQRTGILDSISYSGLLKNIMHSIDESILDFYSGRSKRIYRSVTIDTSRVFFHEYGWEFMDIKSLALPDEKFFEYHKIRIDLTEVDDFVYIRWDFKGKYASGISVSPKLDDYKLMESDYPIEMIDFERVLFNHIENNLHN